jgi:hypothetical protein
MTLQHLSRSRLREHVPKCRLKSVAVRNESYETGHQLVNPCSVFSTEISAIWIALERIQISK